MEERISKDIFYLLRVFCSVAETGSFSTAAEKLGVQGPAVSKAVSRLERETHQRLFNRTTRSLEMTEAGRGLYSQAPELLLSMKAMLESTLTDNRVAGRLKVTATPAVGDYLAEHCIMGMKARYPELNLALALSNDIVALPSQHIDVALRSSNNLEDSFLTSRVVFRARRVLVASPHYLEREGMPVSPADLMGVDCLNFLHRKDYGTWQYEDGRDTAQVSTTPSFSCNHYAVLKQVCLQGGGIARLFDYQVQSELRSGALVAILPQLHWGEQTIHAVYHGKMADSPKLKAFLDYLSECALR